MRIFCTWYLCTTSSPSSLKVTAYVIGLLNNKIASLMNSHFLKKNYLIAWIEKGSLASPIENLCPSTVQMETPQCFGSAEAS